MRYYFEIVMKLAGAGVPAALPRDVQFFLIAERGILESQALLLCESVRAFGGAYAKCPITVVSPRPSRRPCRETIRRLGRLQVEHVALNLESPCPSYGPSYRILAAAYLERESRSAVLVQLDSDTIFVGEPDFGLAGADAAARPVDVKGMSTEGEGDAFDPYWRTLCRLLEVDYEAIPWITTTVDRKTVRANFNGGLLAVRPARGLFRRTAEFFLRLVRAQHRPWAGCGTLVKSGTGMVNREGSDYWGTSQATFSLSVTSLGGVMQILPPSYNVPLHSFDLLAPLPAPPVHVHYHWLCSAGETDPNPLTDGRLNLAPAVRDWIRSRLPLRIPEPRGLERLVRSLLVQS